MVPQIARIMRYGYVGERNVFWENPDLAGKTIDMNSKDWSNYGGDKIWNSPQIVWGWPPDNYLDAGPCKAEKLSGGRLKITGKQSPLIGIRFSRIIQIASSGTEVSIINEMKNLGNKPVEWGIWEVAQTDAPLYGVLPRYRKSKFPLGLNDFATLGMTESDYSMTDTEIRLYHNTKIGMKAGIDSPEGWAKASWNNLHFTLSAAYQRGKRYPDDGCWQELYAMNNPHYMELEILSPLYNLKPGASAAFTTRWKLTR